MPYIVSNTAFYGSFQLTRFVNGTTKDDGLYLPPSVVLVTKNGGGKIGT